MKRPEKLTPEWVRANFPASVAIADEFKDVFGDGVIMTAAEENGQVIGKFTKESDFTGERARCGLLGIRVFATVQTSAQKVNHE